MGPQRLAPVAASEPASELASAAASAEMHSAAVLRQSPASSIENWTPWREPHEMSPAQSAVDNEVSPVAMRSRLRRIASDSQHSLPSPRPSPRRLERKRSIDDVAESP